MTNPTALARLRTRWQFEIEDSLRFSPWLRRAGSWWWRRKGMAVPCADNHQRIVRIQKLCSAATLTTEAHERQRIERLIRDTIATLDTDPIDWTETYPAVHDPAIVEAVILKPWVGEREKGVLLVSFERQWIKLLCHGDPRAFAGRYTLIVGPSWTPPHSLGVTVFPELYPDRVFATISQQADMVTLPHLSPKVIPVPLLASNWVNPDDFVPVAHRQRDIDIVMVATFGKYKRHHALLKALSQMPAGLRVMLVGTHSDDLGAIGVRELARAYGVEDRLVEVGAADYAGVARAFCRSKVSVIMSRREGSCQAVVESMFADTPVGVLEQAELGSRIYVNEHTGRFLRENDLAADLMDLLAKSATFSPRQWVIEHKVSCHDSTRILNDLLREHALSAGQQWTRDLAVHAWNPYPELVRSEDKEALRAAYRDIYERFGLQIGPDPARWQPERSSS